MRVVIGVLQKKKAEPVISKQEICGGTPRPEKPEDLEVDIYREPKSLEESCEKT